MGVLLGGKERPNSKGVMHEQKLFAQQKKNSWETVVGGVNNGAGVLVA